MALHAYWARADEGSSPGFTLLSEVGAWLETLRDVEGDAELRRIQEAVQALKKPSKESVFPICAAWQQAKRRNQKNLTVAVVVEELTEKVLAASHGAKLRRELMQRTADSGAGQPADDATDVVADVVVATRSGEEEDMREMQLAPQTSLSSSLSSLSSSVSSLSSCLSSVSSSSAPPGKRLRTAEEQRGKRKGSQQEAPQVMAAAAPAMCAAPVPYEEYVKACVEPFLAACLCEHTGQFMAQKSLDHVAACRAAFEHSVQLFLEKLGHYTPAKNNRQFSKSERKNKGPAIAAAVPAAAGKALKAALQGGCLPAAALHGIWQGFVLIQEWQRPALPRKCLNTMLDAALEWLGEGANAWKSDALHELSQPRFLEHIDIDSWKMLAPVLGGCPDGLPEEVFAITLSNDTSAGARAGRMGVA